MIFSLLHTPTNSFAWRSMTPASGDSLARSRHSPSSLFSVPHEIHDLLPYFPHLFSLVSDSLEGDNPTQGAPAASFLASGRPRLNRIESEFRRACEQHERDTQGVLMKGNDFSLTSNVLRGRTVDCPWRGTHGESSGSRICPL